MNLFTLTSISKQFSERLLFDHASLQINEGDRIGLIGVNGSGKSTLLRIVAGLEAPDSGAVSAPGGVRIEYLPQEPPLDDTLTVLETIFRGSSPQMQLLAGYEDTVIALQNAPNDEALQLRLMELAGELDHTGGWAAEANAKTVLTQLGVSDFHKCVAILSGGQRKRVALARALIDRADLLILDEPTNHIDAATIAWLEEYLAETPGALLMVTHDRYFLDRVVNRIVELDRRQLVSYTGNYSRYLESRALHHERLVAVEAKRQNLLRRELEWLRRQPMARGAKQKARKQRVDELLRLRNDSGEDRVAIALATRRLGSKALTARHLTKRYGGRAVVDHVDLHLEPGERLGVIGPNGAGKSTLLDMLAGATKPDAGVVQWGETVRVGYYDQRSVRLKEEMRLIEFIEAEASLIRTHDGGLVEAAQMLEWFLFPRPMQYARIGSLSGGERRRLYLLRTLIHQPNVLLLDEPTNDLDIQTLAVLEEFLDHFTGCLVVASHDRYFLDRTVDFLAAMENGKLGPAYPSPYSLFVRLSAEAQAGEPHGAASAPPTQSVAPQREAKSRKLSWKEERELAEVEGRVAALERRKAELTTEMNDVGAHYQRWEELTQQMSALDAELETALERWMALADKAA